MKPAKSFQANVYAIVGRIPKGKVATYGQVAKMAGSALAARAVGICMKHNSDRDRVPCHRVVASDGRLTGYAFGSGVSTKKKMLLDEGVAFTGDRVDLAASRWQPAEGK